MEYTRRALGSDADSGQTQWAQMDAAVSELVSLLKERAERRMTEEEPRFAVLRQQLLDSGYLGPEAREFLNRHRTLQQFWDRTAHNFASYRERRSVVDEAFESTYARLSENRVRPIALDEDILQDLEMSAARRIWEKAQVRLNSDTDGAITMARALLESVCQKILDALGEVYSRSESPSELFKKTAVRLLPPSLPGVDNLRSLAKTAANIVEQIALYRDHHGDAHGKPLDKEIAQHHAEFAVNLAGSTAVFLIECFRSVQDAQSN